MHTEETLRALGTPFEIQPEVLAACERFDADLWSDVYKDAHGFRPRMGLAGYAAAQLDAMWDRTISAKDEAMEREAMMERNAVARWDEMVAGIIAIGAGDYATAVRWLLHDEQDLDYLLWANGIHSFENTRRIRELAGL